MSWEKAGHAWGAQAWDWAIYQEPIADPLYDAVLTALEVRSGMKLLDVACGARRAVERAAGRGAACTGVDASGQLLDVAAEAFLESAGLRVERRGTVPCVCFYRSEAEAVRGFGSSAPAYAAASHSGAEAVQDALAAAVARHADPDNGVVSLAGVMAFVTASRR